MLKRIKKMIKKFIDNLGRANESTFGHGGLDCCDLSSKKKSELKKKEN